MWKQIAASTLLTLIACATCAPIDDNDINLNKTIQNVEDILRANPQLPRLTQQEILTLLNIITAEEGVSTTTTTTKKPKVVQEEKLMVVLPFQPTEDDVDVTELYTKKPITKYVTNAREEITTTASPEKKESVKKKANKPKKATAYKTDEAKDLLSQMTKNELVKFNDDFFDQSHQIAFPDVSAYESFKPMPKPKYGVDDLPIDVKNILKALEMENTKEKIDAVAFPSETAEVLTDFSLKDDSQGHLSQGLDPLSLDDVVAVDDSLGNDIKKRQKVENSTKETETTTTTAPDEDSKKEDDSKKDEEGLKKDEGPNVADLEDSFGASPADDDPSEAELPPPRRNGFYYMFDWNSFLEVGDGDNKVNIRFDPKLGDPQRFIEVNVP